MPVTFVVKDRDGKELDHIRILFGNGDICVSSGTNKNSGFPVISLSALNKVEVVGNSIPNDTIEEKIVVMEFEKLQSLTVLLNAVLDAQNVLLKLPLPKRKTITKK